MSLENLDKSFSFFIPATLEKGKDANGNETMRIKGIASDLVEDTDGQTLDPSGFDLTPFLTKGFLNWDHMAKKSASAIIGEPDLAKIVNNGKQLYIEGFLYPDSDEAKATYKLAQVLEKNSKTRRLGFSIEGQVLEKDAINPNWIKRARITSVAITPMPKNPNTLMQIMKGETSSPLMSNEYDNEVQEVLDKAVSAEGLSNEGVLPEDVEGAKNPNQIPLKDKKKKKDEEVEKEGSVGSYLKKSEVYGIIANSYTTNPRIAAGIYSLIEETNQKLFSMSKQQISIEAVNKAFEFLQKGEDALALESKEKKEEKKEEKVEKGNGGDGGSDTNVSDDMEKAMQAGEECLKKGMDEDGIKEELKKAGFSEETSASAASSVVSKASAEKDGGTVTQVAAPTINKGEEAEPLAAALLSGPNMEEIVKGAVDELKKFSDRKFSAVGTLLQHAMDTNDILKGEINQLKEEVQKIGGQSNGRKSITARPVEKFEKGENGEELSGENVYNLSKAQDIVALGDRMYNDAMVARQANRPDLILEKGVAEFEIAKSMPSQMIAYLSTKGITVIGRK